MDINGYSPTNFGGKYYGTVTLVDALAHSINTITVNLAQEVGVGNVIAAANRVGITSPLQPHASLALGTAEVTPLELTAAYAAFANGGYRSLALSGDGSRHRRQTGLSAHRAGAQQRVIDEEVNRDLTAMLVWRGDRRHRRLCLAAWPRSRRQDRHHPGSR